MSPPLDPRPLIRLQGPKLLAWLVFISLFLTACANPSIEDYTMNTPRLQIESFFQGNLSAHGVVKNRSGAVIRTFNADIKASWLDGVGKLDETFVFDDGEKQQRIWHIHIDQQGHYFASANDVIGKHQMHFSGNALFMEYILNINYKDSTIAVKVDDKMFLVNEHVIINESIMSKWGVKVGSVQLTIIKNH